MSLQGHRGWFDSASDFRPIKCGLKEGTHEHRQISGKKKKKPNSRYEQFSSENDCLSTSGMSIGQKSTRINDPRPTNSNPVKTAGIKESGTGWPKHFLQRSLKMSTMVAKSKARHSTNYRKFRSRNARTRRGCWIGRRGLAIGRALESARTRAPSPGCLVNILSIFLDTAILAHTYLHTRGRMCGESLENRQSLSSEILRTRYEFSLERCFYIARSPGALHCRALVCPGDLRLPYASVNLLPSRSRAPSLVTRFISRPPRNFV